MIEQGEPHRIVCAAIEVTERRRAEDALRQAEERLRLAVDSAAIGTWDYDVKSDTLTWSSRLKEIFGVAPDERITYELFLSLIHPDDREATRAEADAAFHGENDGFYAGEYRILRPDGRVRSVIARGRAFFENVDGEKRVVKFLGTVFDVTDRKETEHALREAIHAREETLATVSHDLRTPLAVMALSTGLLLAEEQPPDAREQLTIMRDAVWRMDALIRDLLDAARMEAGQFRVDATSEAPAVLLADAAADAGSLLASRGIVLDCPLPGDLPHVRADRRRLRQVFSNLLGNAAKFTPAGGSVTVTAERVAGDVAFCVTDTGAGIGSDDLPRLFDVFSQGRRSDPSQGAGLGLAIVKGIIDAHGGDVRVESKRGVGTTVCFTLPLAR